MKKKIYFTTLILSVIYTAFCYEYGINNFIRMSGFNNLNLNVILVLIGGGSLLLAVISTILLCLLFNRYKENKGEYQNLDLTLLTLLVFFSVLCHVALITVINTSTVIQYFITAKSVSYDSTAESLIKSGITLMITTIFKFSISIIPIGFNIYLLTKRKKME
jgi:hypothetical protein